MGRRVEIPYEGLLDIPEQKIGSFEIRHTIYNAGRRIPVTSFRTRMYGGHYAKDLVYDHETRWHELLEDGGVWTSDFPIEQFQQRQSLRGFRGRVLIGGLGLGVVVQMLRRYKSVSQIDVVEKSLEVCQMVQPYVSDERTRFFRTDLYDFLRERQDWKKPLWDYAFFDTWTSDGEFTFYKEVIPLRKLASPLVKNNITCWNEDVMKGQIQRSLVFPFEMLTLKASCEKVGRPLEHDIPTLEYLATENDSEWHNRNVPFYRAILKVNPDFSDTLSHTLTLERLRFMAAKWVYNYGRHGGDDDMSWFEKRAEDNWSFSEPFATQLIEQRRRKAS